eukprot:1992932-Prorocentrum_lima.AAC.1
MKSVDCPSWHLSEAICCPVDDFPVAVAIDVHSAVRSDAVQTRWAPEATGDGAPVTMLRGSSITGTVQ